LFGPKWIPGPAEHIQHLALAPRKHYIQVWRARIVLDQAGLEEHAD